MGKMYLPEPITSIIQKLIKAGLKPMIVGGAVRDSLLNHPIKDIDIELFNLKSLDQLEPLLTPFGTIKQTGKAFGVLKCRISSNLEIDFALPRTEHKTGKGHRGFKVEHPSLTFKEAAQRRDFTINAIGYCPITGEYIDPFNGKADLQQKVLRHIGPQFSEDPLRVYRAIQFAGRFSLSIAPETLILCQKIDTKELPKERIFEEFKKLLLQAPKPSVGFELLASLNLLKYYPELAALRGCPQDPIWHPEGDVWTHTMLVIDEMATLIKSQPQSKQLMFMLSALCHDFGKPLTTKKRYNRWTSYGHEPAGAKPTQTFINRLTADKKLIESVTPLVIHHLKPLLLWQSQQKHKVSDAAIRRLATKINIEDLLILVKADHFGRTTPESLKREFTVGDWLLSRAKKLNVHQEAPKPFITGKDLLNLGQKPGPKFGKKLKDVYNLQLDGTLSSREDALAYIQKKFKKP